MVENNRFSSIEHDHAPLPDNLKTAISRLTRFETLEIAGAHLANTAVVTPIERILCPFCGQANEKGRDLCWACYKHLVATTNATPADDQEVCVVLDGVSYRSNDPNLPPDIVDLIGRIRKKGYSPELLKQWQNERVAARRISPAAASLMPTYPRPDRVEAFQGQRVTVLRLDGVLYKSDDANLPPAIVEIFSFIEKEGITPALMQHLRLYGTKVKYRPISIHQPSDGDLSFWDATKKALRG